MRTPHTGTSLNSSRWCMEIMTIVIHSTKYAIINTPLTFEQFHASISRTTRSLAIVDSRFSARIVRSTFKNSTGGAKRANNWNSLFLFSAECQNSFFVLRFNLGKFFREVLYEILLINFTLNLFWTYFFTFLMMTWQQSFSSQSFT